MTPQKKLDRSAARLALFDRMLAEPGLSAERRRVLLSLRRAQEVALSLRRRLV